jgi:hypothetical protein
MTKEPTTLEKILHIERRIEGQTTDMLGLFQTFFYDLITLHQLRKNLGAEMIADAFKVTEGVNMPTKDRKEQYDEVPYDSLRLVDKVRGDYGTREYVFQGQLGKYRFRIGHSITDEGVTMDVYQNDDQLVTLFPTRSRSEFAGKNEDGDFYIFRFRKEGVEVLKRKQDT